MLRETLAEGASDHFGRPCIVRDLNAGVRLSGPYGVPFRFYVVIAMVRGTDPFSRH